MHNLSKPIQIALYGAVSLSAAMASVALSTMVGYHPAAETAVANHLHDVFQLVAGGVVGICGMRVAGIFLVR